jgi:hypothetical protein
VALELEQGYPELLSSTLPISSKKGELATCGALLPENSRAHLDVSKSATNLRMSVLSFSQMSLADPPYAKNDP